MDHIDADIPQLGGYIPVSYHHLLQPRLAILRNDEVVAYEIHDPLEDAEDQQERDNDIGDPVYIYAKVTEVTQGDDLGTSCIKYKYKIDIGDDDLIEANAPELYRFVMKPTDSEGSPILHCDLNNITKVKSDVLDIIKEAWNEKSNVRWKILKRLQFQWHPNEGFDSKLSSEVFLYIQYAISRLEKGQPVNETFDEIDGTSYSNSYAENVIRSRAHRQRIHQKQFEKFHFGHAKSTPPKYSEKNPQISEARRWMRQAEHDLQAVCNDMGSNQSLEWACFKCHQAAEKALKATQFAEDANLHDMQHNLRLLCNAVNDSRCVSLASQLESSLGGSARIRYPDHHGWGKIPHTVYTREQAEQAYSLASEIVMIGKSLVQ